MSSHNNYPSYRKLSKKEKQKRIDQAEQHQKHRSFNPQGDCLFDEIHFIEFEVEQKKKMIKLCTYRHRAKTSEPLALVIMLHGLNSHVGHGAHIAENLSKAGIEIVGFDHRGFGRSEGEPGYAQSLENHIEDTLNFTKMMQKMYTNIPFFCMGLSMGGMTTYHMTLRFRQLFQGAIMMAPAIKNSVGGFLVGMTKTVASLLPKSTKLLKPIYGKATKNPQITDDIKKDKWAFSQRACLSTIQMLASTMDTTPKTFSQYKCPFMIIQGGLDKLVNPEGAFDLYDHSPVKVQDKELVFYEDMWHDIWHEPEIFEIIQRITSWILGRLKIYNKKIGKAQEVKQQVVPQPVSEKTEQVPPEQNQ